MRTLTANTITQINTNLGTEPITIIKIEWASPIGTKYYSDKTFVLDSLNCEGRILNLSTLDSIIKTQTYGNINEATLSLDDTDGELKTIFDSVNLVDSVITIYHHYEGLSESDLTSILVGKIQSPISWDEGTRTLELNILTSPSSSDFLLELKETNSDFLNEEDIGKIFPLGFGTNLRVPCTKVERTAVGTLASNIYMYSTWYTGGGKITFFDQNFKVFGGEKFPQNQHITLEIDNTLFGGTMVGENFFGLFGAFNATFNTPSIISRPSSDTDYNNPAVFWTSDPNIDLKGKYIWITFNWKFSYTEFVGNDGETYKTVIDDAATPYNDDGEEIEKLTKYEYQNCIVECTNQEDNKIYVNNPIVTEFGNKIRLGKDDSSNQIKAVTGKPEYRFKLLPSEDTPLRWDIAAGNEVRLKEGLSPLYIFNSVPSLEVLEVIGKKGEEYYAIPENYYTLELNKIVTINGNTENISCIYFDKSLSGRGEGWSDQVFISFKSSLGSNTADIIKWIAENRTNLTVDLTSYNLVKSKVENYPSHFWMSNQKDAVVAIQEIAWQARLGTYIENNILYMFYLSEEPTTIAYACNQNNIELKSMVIKKTDSENLITKIIATWNDFHNLPSRQLIKLNNESIYDLREEEIPFYIYNVESLVDKSATFWSNRLSNIWLNVTVKTFVTSLAVQLWDAVTIEVPYINNGSITKGIVENITNDTENHNIALTIWIPITFGEGSPWLDDSEDTKPNDPGSGLTTLDYPIFTEVKRIRLRPGISDKGRAKSDDDIRTTEEAIQDEEMFDYLRHVKRFFRIVEVKKNMVKGRLLNDDDLTVDGELKQNYEDRVSQEIWIAKLPELREKNWVDRTIDNVYYEKIDTNTRWARGFFEESPIKKKEHIIPRYTEEGEQVIRAIYSPEGTGVFTNETEKVVWEEIEPRKWGWDVKEEDSF